MKRSRLSILLFILFLMAVTACGAFWVFYGSSAKEQTLIPLHYSTISHCDWETESGAHGTTDLPCGLAVEGNEAVTYRTLLPSDVQDDEWLCLLTHNTHEVRINGQLRQVFDEDAVGIPGSIEKSTYLFYKLSSADSAAELEITLESPYTSNGFLRPLYLGDSYSIADRIVRQKAFRYMGILVLFVLAMIGIMAGLVLTIVRESPANIIYISIGILLVSAWLILDDTLYLFLFPNTYVDGITSYLVAALTPFPFMMYADQLQERRYHRLYNLLEFLNLVYFCAVCAARFYYHIPLSSHLLYFNLPIVLIGFICLIPIAWDVITKKSRNYQLMIYGLIAFMILSTVDIVLINISYNHPDGNLILIGLYILAVAALFQQVQESDKIFQKLDSQDRQITEISEQNKDLTIRAQTDALTGLYNSEYLKEAVHQRVVDKNTGALLLFDLDNFKEINDTYGHLEGDRVLVAYAKALKNSFRREDIICRLGGDEFVVFMTECATENLVQHKSLLIMDYFKRNPNVAPYHNLVSASLGVSYIPDDGSDFESLYRKADERMYANKGSHSRR